MQPTRTLTAHCTLSHHPAGQPLLTVDNGYAKAEISLFGAHVLSYQRHDEPASIWLSDKAVLDGSKPIRGGIPLCWPWFGPAPARVGSGKPSHGFARTSLWTLDGVSDHGDGTLVHLSLRDNETTRQLWPHAFELELDVLVGKELALVLTTRNTGKEPLVYSGALHTYLQISSPEAVSVSGLGEPYADKLTGQNGQQQCAGRSPVDPVSHPGPATRAPMTAYGTVMQDLHLEIKQLIIDSLNLEGLTPDDIDSQAPLFGDGLGLDSIDALELGLAIKGRYGIVLSAEDENTRRHFASVAALVALVQAQSKGEA